MANRKPEAQSSASIGLEARLPKAINQDAFAAEKVRILEKSISLADSVVPYLKGRGSEQFAEEYNVCSADTSRIHAAVARKISQDTTLQQGGTAVFLLGGYILLREITEHQREIHAIPDKFDPQVPPDVAVILDRTLEDVVRYDEYANSGVLNTVLSGGTLNDFRSGRPGRPTDSLRFFVENSPFLSDNDDLTFDDFIEELKARNQKPIDREFPQLSYAMISNAILLLNKALRLSRQDIETIKIQGSSTTREVLQKGVEFVINLKNAQADIRHVLFNPQNSEEFTELATPLETYLMDERYWRSAIIALGIEPSEFVQYHRSVQAMAQSERGNLYRILSVRLQMYASSTSEISKRHTTLDKLTAIVDKDYNAPDDPQTLDWGQIKGSVESIRKNTSREKFVVESDDIVIDKGGIKKPSKIELLMGGAEKIKVKLSWSTEAQPITVDLDFDLNTQEFDWSFLDHPNSQDLVNELKRVKEAAFDAVRKVTEYVEKAPQYQQQTRGRKKISTPSSGAVYRDSDGPYPGSRRIGGKRRPSQVDLQAGASTRSRKNAPTASRKREEVQKEVVIQGKVGSKLRGVDSGWVPVIQDALSALAVSGDIRNRDSYTHVVTTPPPAPNITITLKKVSPGVYRINSIKPCRNGH